MTPPTAAPAPGLRPGAWAAAFALLMGGLCLGVALSSALRGDDWRDAILWAVLGAACLTGVAQRGALNPKRGA